jgi:hypothetical protein
MILQAKENYRKCKTENMQLCIMQTRWLTYMPPTTHSSTRVAPQVPKKFNGSMAGQKAWTCWPKQQATTQFEWNPRNQQEDRSRCWDSIATTCPRTAPMPLPVCRGLHKARYLELRKQINSWGSRVLIYKHNWFRTWKVFVRMDAISLS